MRGGGIALGLVGLLSSALALSAACQRPTSSDPCPALRDRWLERMQKLDAQAWAGPTGQDAPPSQASLEATAARFLGACRKVGLAPGCLEQAEKGTPSAACADQLAQLARVMVAGE
jgi:hypothetical protein